jgi:hypothetical protein
MDASKPRSVIDGAKLAFLAIVGLCAVGLVLLLVKLPANWRTAASLWLIFGLPSLFFVLRVWRGHVQMYLADLERAPRPQPPASLGVGERDRGGELRVVEGSDGHHGRRLL